jgi:predicted MPP superfamily phosphohydrolase
MRALVVADLHYSLPQFDWLLAAAPEFDLVIFAGDALDIGSLVDFRAQILVVKKYLSLLSARTRVILCSGNHDLDERSAEGEKISRWVGEVRELGIACDGDSLAIGDTLFTVCPWSSNASRTSFATPPPNGWRAGSGCITRRRPTRRRAGVASDFSATSNWCNGSPSTSRRW